jgi:hypothetical protein
VTKPLSTQGNRRAAFTIAAAWRAAVFVTARAYDVRSEVLGALGRPGRGGGSCTPRAYWDVRKVAVYVAVLTADCAYAELARVLGMHRDTVTSQCEELRLRVIEDAMLDRRLTVLEQRARARMARELASIFGDLEQAIAHAMDLADGAIGPMTAAAVRQTLMARACAISPPGGDNPTVRDAAFASRSDAALFTFPRLGAVE